MLTVLQFLGYGLKLFGASLDLQTIPLVLNLEHWNHGNRLARAVLPGLRRAPRCKSLVSRLVADSMLARSTQDKTGPLVISGADSGEVSANKQRGL